MHVYMHFCYINGTYVRIKKMLYKKSHFYTFDFGKGVQTKIAQHNISLRKAITTFNWIVTQLIISTVISRGEFQEQLLFN